MNHSNMQLDSEHVQKLNAQIQKLQAENIELRRQNNQLQYEKSFIESNPGVAVLGFASLNLPDRVSLMLPI
jgi:predicted RNase H-like nuclease (RuvC/YqgF family)